MCKVTKRLWQLAATSAGLLLLSLLLLIGQAQSAQVPGAMTPTPIYLEQGWNDADREAYYYLSQGSQLLPYRWFLALEQADSETPFRDDAHMRELGYIVQPPNPRNNPDGLPIGFVKDDNKEIVAYLNKVSFESSAAEAGVANIQEWLGLTCAACHTGQFDYADKSVLIDGGAGLVDHQTFIEQLGAALQATQEDMAKMERFARNVLDPNWNPGEQDALRQRVAHFSEKLNRLVLQNETDLAYGYGRLDAFGAILNRICETALGIPENHAESNAPVSYPFLWTTPELDWVQWNSLTSNPIARNTGEVLGVFGHMQLTGTPETGQFESSVRLHNLDRLEWYVEQLEAPPWPGELFGAIDGTLAEQGKVLYDTNCKGCHVIREVDRDGDGKPDDFPRRRPQPCEKKQFVVTNAPPLSKLRTDDQMIRNVLSRCVDPGALAPLVNAPGTRHRCVDGELIPEPAPQNQNPCPDGKVLAAEVLGKAVRGVIGRQLTATGKQGAELGAMILNLKGQRTTDAQLDPPPQIIQTYKARPLNGVWATAPFLHNGSVPNLYQLMLPEEQRVKTFRIGSREFDPVNVGYLTDSGFEFDTSLAGNRNTGHSGSLYTQTKGADGQWRNYTEKERRALVEFMKTLL